MQHDNTSPQINHGPANLAEELSAWADDQLTATESARVQNALKNDSQLKAQWDQWHLIGDVMRSASLARSSNVADQISKRLAAEPVHFSPAKLKARKVLFGKPRFIYAAASAAAVAFVAVVALAPQMQENIAPMLLAGKSSATPISPSQLEDPRLRELLDTHGAMAFRPVSVEVR
jgi:sigma-E factor negative regulatory protein RseA